MIVQYICVSALKIHVSESCKAILGRLGGYMLEARGLVSMKVTSLIIPCAYACMMARKIYHIGYIGVQDRKTALWKVSLRDLS